MLLLGVNRRFKHTYYNVNTKSLSHKQLRNSASSYKAQTKKKKNFVATITGIRTLQQGSIKIAWDDDHGIIRSQEGP